ncbi:2-succinyl-6-hydroxy-2,4-cyclohexadiene-1-carboxylate synthase [Egbenema bharatensis]|uniref:2-succinyl-6-hydroxy-2, 4-cyclohexadiene-1-carboxylate synthase n=1 Tax=Egbenema bharatensis TaxID=3463334 RepID=UPI003A878181
MNITDRTTHNQGHFCSVEAYTFHYYAVGRSTAPPIVFLHGFMGDGREFDTVIDRLSMDYYCLAVDLPGHGKTRSCPELQDNTMPDLAVGIIQFLQALNLQSCSLVGYSMGGRLALYLALHFPAYFSKVVLESASPGLKTVAERADRLRKDQQLAQTLRTLEVEGFPDFLTNWYQQPIFADIQQHPAYGKMLERRLQNDPRDLAQALDGLSPGRQPALWEQLSHNALPMLLLVGALDQKFVRINRAMAEQSPALTLQIIDRCGHTLHLEQPQLFTQRIIDFLAID